MPLDWSPLSQLIDRHERFLVTSHVRPDGDALGSELGMAELLRGFGKDVRVVNSSPTPPRYDFLVEQGVRYEHYGHDVHDADLTDREALVILDLSSWSQLGEMVGFVRAFPGPRVVVDHHVSQDDLGASVIKDTSAEATGTLVLEAARALKAPISPAMATGLLTAIIMDTGWFRHPTTRPSTLRDAAELVEAGAPIHQIYRWLFERNTPGRIRLTGEVLKDIQLELDGRVAHAAVTRDALARTGAIPPDTEDLIDHLVSIAGVEVGLLFIEQMKGGVKLSLRSRKGFDCASLAGRFGGGGHRAAAGAHLHDTLDVMKPQVLKAVFEALAEPAPAQ